MLLLAVVMGLDRGHHRPGPARRRRARAARVACRALACSPAAAETTPRPRRRRRGCPFPPAGAGARTRAARRGEAGRPVVQVGAGARGRRGRPARRGVAAIATDDGLALVDAATGAPRERRRACPRPRAISPRRARRRRSWCRSRSANAARRGLPGRRRRCGSPTPARTRTTRRPTADGRIYVGDEFGGFALGPRATAGWSRTVERRRAAGRRGGHRRLRGGRLRARVHGRADRPPHAAAAGRAERGLRAVARGRGARGRVCTWPTPAAAAISVFETRPRLRFIARVRNLPGRRTGSRSTRPATACGSRSPPATGSPRCRERGEPVEARSRPSATPYSVAVHRAHRPVLVARARRDAAARQTRELGAVRDRRRALDLHRAARDDVRAEASRRPRPRSARPPSATAGPSGSAPRSRAMSL